MKKTIIICLLTILLQSCASVYEKPVGIGKGRDDLKKSPCACVEFYNYQG